MLSGMRAASQGWLGKVVMVVMFGFLIFSFGIWGIGDIFRINHREVVAQVGSREISSQVYRDAFQSELQRLSNRARRNVTTAEALAAGVDRQVLSGLIADAALDQKVQQLGLALSDKTITQAVFSDPAFKNPDGTFNQTAFVQALRQSGYTEDSFLREQRSLYLRRQIVEGIAGTPVVPASMLDAVHRFTDETRAIDYFTLDASAAGEIPAPDDAALQSFYDGRKAEFATPEYRSLVILALTPAALARPDSIPEAEVRAEYDKQLVSRFSVPEKRAIDRIPFKTKEEAAAADAKIKGGASFDVIAKEMGLTADDLSLGAAMTKDFLADPALAAAAFSAQQGAPSGVIETAFGPVILRVTAIQPASVMPYEQAATKLREEMATVRATKTTLQDLHDKIEDQRASAKPIADIATALNLPVLRIDAIDAGGNGKDGKPVAGVPDPDLMLKSAFQSEVGGDNDAVSLRDGGYAWYDVTAIDRARDRPLSEVRDQVVTAWTADQRSLALQKKAAAIVKQIEGGTPIADLAKTDKVEVDSIEGLKRSTSNAPNLSPAVVNAVFSVKDGAAGYALSPDGQSRVVFKVKSTSLPPRDLGIQRTLTPRLATALQEDLMQAYVQKLESDLGVSIDQSVARAALRSSSQDAQQ